MAPDQAYTDFSPECQITQKGLSTALIWGDSHAAALTSGLRELLPNVVQYTASGCPPIVDAVVSSWRPHCRNINAFVLKEVQRLQPQQVFLHANWLSYKEQDPIKHIQMAIDAIYGVSPTTNVTIVGGVPQWLRPLPIVMLHRQISINKDQYRQTPLYGDLEKLDMDLRRVADANRASFVSAIDILCREMVCQVVSRSSNGFRLTAWDYGHLTQVGSALLAKKLLARINADVR